MAAASWPRWRASAHTGTRDVVAVAQWLQFPNELLQEAFWGLEMSLSKKVTRGEGLLSSHTETGGSLENKTRKVKCIYIYFKQWHLHSA